jgi:starch synthase (maltosyl-transferring)
VPIESFGIDEKEPFLVHELLTDTKFIWHGANNFIHLDPKTMPASIMRIQRRLRREHDFDYYL